MNKKFMNKILSARLAIRKEDAEVLASTDFYYRFDKERDKWSLKDENNESTQENDIVMKDDIAIIKVDGPLSYRSSAESIWWDEDTYDSIERAFSKCLADESVKGIVFDINSPGGEVNGCSDLADKIFNARGSKPYGIVARTGGMMCSAAYWLGSSCEKIYTASNGTLGSIGVLCAFRKFNEQIITETVVVSDLSPDKSPDPNTPEGIALIKKELNDLAEVFIQNVARNRGTTVEDVKMNFGKGGVFIGENAVAAKLADGVMSLDDLCQQMKQGTSINGGAVMATNAKGAEAKDPVDMEAVKAQAVAAYKQRVADIDGVFEGLEVSAEEKAGFVDGDKTVADATAFALVKAKEKIASQAEEIKKITGERDEYKSKAETAEKNAEAGLTDQQKKLIKSGLEHQAAAQNGVTAGAANEQITAEQKHAESVKRAAETYYANKRR